MKIKDLTKRLLYYISVPKCVFCGERLDIDDKALCKCCLKLYGHNKTRNCARCSRLLHRCSCPTVDLEKNRIKGVFKVFRYITGEGRCPSSDVIFALKNSNRQDVLEFLSSELMGSITYGLTDLTPESTVIVNIPRRKSAVRNFGYDHAKSLAKSLAKKMNVSYLDLFKSNAKMAQKELSIEERSKNASFTLKSKPSLKGKRVIILDDIITTGSSVKEAAKHLSTLGARKIYAAAVAIAYKDDKIVF